MYTQVRGRYCGLRVICKNVTVTVTVTSDADSLKQQRKQQGFTRCQRRRHGDDRDVVGCTLLSRGLRFGRSSVFTWRYGK